MIMQDYMEIPLSDFDDVFEGAGFIMARKGRFIFSQSTLSRDEHQDFLKELRDGAKDSAKSIEKKILELETILQQYHPFDILANILVLNSIHNVETYKEYEHSGVLAFVEYLTLLLLTKPFESYSERSLEPRHNTHRKQYIDHQHNTSQGCSVSIWHQGRPLRLLKKR